MFEWPNKSVLHHPLTTQTQSKTQNHTQNVFVTSCINMLYTNKKKRMNAKHGRKIAQDKMCIFARIYRCM